ncbi:hypothetical protein [Legionella sainthelensi]|uniref:hypothetical protein n=1 Tax=Legionella sainthelensi TaxID=28087 RepID=UPI0030CDE736
MIIKTESVKTASVEDNALKSAKKILESAPLELALKKAGAEETNSKKVSAENTSSKKIASKKVVIKRKNIALTKVSFEELPGWDQADVKKIFISISNFMQSFFKAGAFSSNRYPAYQLKSSRLVSSV